jgi:flavin-binding protein dodecin
VVIVNIYEDVGTSVMPVHKEVIVTATSSESWEEAALNAVDRTEATVENLQWAVVQDQSVELESAENPQFKTKVKIGFEVAE